MRDRFLLVASALAAALLFAACSASPNASTSKPQAVATAVVPPAPAATFPVSITDDLGRKVTISKKPARIVSLAPANTEIVAALGLQSELVGVTTYDDYPASVKTLPKMGDFTSPNLEAIAAAKPDLVLVTGGVQADAVKRLEKLGAVVVAVDPKTLVETLTSIRMVGTVTGVPAAADAVVLQMTKDFNSIVAAVSKLAPVTCFVEIAQNPLYTAGSGTLMDEMIRAAGGTNVVTKPGFVGYSLEQLLKDDPHVYFVTKGSMSDPSGLAKRPGFSKLSAVKAGRVIILDDDLVSRPGPRIMQGLRQIAAGLHPEAFS